MQKDKADEIKKDAPYLEEDIEEEIIRLALNAYASWEYLHAVEMDRTIIGEGKEKNNQGNQGEA